MDNVSVDVIRNDELNLNDVSKYDKILISPGPGLPREAANLMQLIQLYHKQIPMFGVCLGHQAIAEFFGSSLFNSQKVYHGIATPIKFIEESNLFKGIPNEIKVGRYHSWMVDKKTLPSCLTITAIDSEENIMAMKHTEHNIQTVQFHPESILTEYGKDMIKNWVLFC
jgi:anthranilate synthase component 2